MTDCLGARKIGLHGALTKKRFGPVPRWRQWHGVTGSTRTAFLARPLSRLWASGVFRSMSQVFAGGGSEILVLFPKFIE